MLTQTPATIPQLIVLQGRTQEDLGLMYFWLSAKVALFVAQEVISGV